MIIDSFEVERAARAARSQYTAQLLVAGGRRIRAAAVWLGRSLQTLITLRGPVSQK